jgi:hypothetical protein
MSERKLMNRCLDGEAKAIEIARQVDSDPRNHTDAFRRLADGSNTMPASTRIDSVATLLWTKQPHGWRAHSAELNEVCERYLNSVESQARQKQADQQSAAALARRVATRPGVSERMAAGGQARTASAPEAAKPAPASVRAKGKQSRAGSPIVVVHNPRHPDSPTRKAELRYTADGTLIDPVDGLPVTTRTSGLNRRPASL